MKGEKGEDGQVYVNGVTLPLSVILKGNKFVEELAKYVPYPDGTKRNFPIAMGLDYVPATGEEIVEMSQAAKEKFFQFLGVAGIYGAPPKSHSKKDGQLEGEGSDREGETAHMDVPMTEVSTADFKEKFRASGLPVAPMELGADREKPIPPPRKPPPKKP